MTKKLVILLVGVTSYFAYGQKDTSMYKLHVKKADSLYRVKDYKKSAIEYQKAFDLNSEQTNQKDRYNAACSFALDGNLEKAFYNLFYSAENPKIKYNNYDHIIVDQDLTSLHNDKRWNKLIKIVKANKTKAEKDLDKPLVAELGTIYQEDQAYRRQLTEIDKKFGRESDEMKSQWKIINEKDSVNLIKVKKILDERGWLGSNIIGREGNMTLFLVIQHSDLETQEKYLPMMKDAVQKGNAFASNLALLEDRIALRKGKKQIYGSQIGIDQITGEYYILPLIDPDNVDKRREEVGLGTIQDYISNWQMIWNIDEYKKKLPEYEEKQKQL